MINVKFKSKEAYDRFKNTSFEINRAFGELVDENTVFQVPTLSELVLVNQALVENQSLKDLDSVFFDYDTNPLFCWPTETNLLEEIEYQPGTNKTLFNSTVESVRINFVGDYNKIQLIKLKDKLDRLIEEF